jgi:hypothetical protein
MTATVSEPAWLAGKRAAARELYEHLEVPSNREEAWRYTNLRGFDPESYDVRPAALALGEADLPDGVVFASLASRSTCRCA